MRPSSYDDSEAWMENRPHNVLIASRFISATSRLASDDDHEDCKLDLLTVIVTLLGWNFLRKRWHLAAH